MFLFILDLNFRALLCALTLCDIGQDTGTCHSLECYRGVICILKPLEPPQTTLAHHRWKFITLAYGLHTAISLTTLKVGVLGVAALEDALAASRDRDIKVVVGEVVSDIGGLYDHALSLDRW